MAKIAEDCHFFKKKLPLNFFGQNYNFWQFFDKYVKFWPMFLHSNSNFPESQMRRHSHYTKEDILSYICLNPRNRDAYSCYFVVLMEIWLNFEKSILFS